MFKRISALVLVMMLILSGCQSESMTAKQKLENLLKNTNQADSFKATFDGEMNIELEGNELDDNVAAMAGMMQDIKMDGVISASNIRSDFQFGGDMTVDMSGMAISFSIYMDKENAIVDYPMLGQYIVINFDRLLEMANEDEEVNIERDVLEKAMKDLYTVVSPKAITAMMNNVKDENISEVANFEFAVAGETNTSDALQIEMSPLEFREFTVGYISDLLKDEEIYNLIDSYELPEFPENYQAYLADVDEMLADLDDEESWQELEDSMQDSDIVILVSGDEQDRVSFMHADINMAMKPTDDIDENIESMQYDMSYNYHYEYDNVEVEVIEANEENSVDFEDLFGAF